MNKRDSFIKQYAWAIPDYVAIAECKKYLPLVEVGAGSGYWASLIDPLQIDCWDNGTLDYDKTYALIQPGGPEVLKGYGTHWNLFLCWPPYDEPMAYDCLMNFKGKHIVYVGEGKGGCTGCDKFHDKLYSEFDNINTLCIQQWDGLHDCLTVWERKQMYITGVEAARLLGIKPSVFRNLVTRRELPAGVIINGITKYDKDKLDALPKVHKSIGSK